MTGRERRYIYARFPAHLASAGKYSALESLLLNPVWLKNKLAIDRKVTSLVQDYKLTNTLGSEAQVIERSLERGARALSTDPRQLFAQLAARIDVSGSQRLAAFLARAR
jgi:hypothetical protein